MDQGLIPRRYAKALHVYALEKGTDKRVYELLKQLSMSMEQQPQLCHVMANPYVPAQDKARLLATASGAGNDDAVFADFVSLLIKKQTYRVCKANSAGLSGHIPQSKQYLSGRYYHCRIS